MDIEHYKVLIEVVKVGNITKAAKQLGYTQSGVSRMISRLEKELGVALISRQRDGITLREEAIPLIEQMKVIVEQEAILYKKAREIACSRREKIRLGCFQSFSTRLLPDLLKEYMEEDTNLVFEVSVCATYTELEENVRSGELDLAFLAEEFAKDLVFIGLFRDHYYAVVNQSDRAADQDIISLSDLLDERFIIPNNAILNTDFMAFLKQHQTADSALQLDALNDTTTIAMVSRGIGRSIVPGLFLNEIPGNVRVIPIREDLSRNIGVCMTEETAKSGVFSRFIRYCRHKLANDRRTKTGEIFSPFQET